ncbi:MAG: leucine--tRNA ligase [Nanopusillaceae archaeon]
MNSSFEFFKNIEEKWQKIWEEKKCYCPEIDKDKPKFFITVPYPYVSGLLHLGNAYTFARGDFLARYKRLKGFNVLWAQGWHLTGSPIISKAYRLKEGDQKIIKDLKADGIPESDFEKLKSPEGWAIYFMQLNREYFKKFGFSIDWRREFYTTYLNPWYDKFVKWQYNKLKEKGLITKGEHPVIIDPKTKIIVGDHDRADEFAGISYEEGLIIKFYWKTWDKYIKDIEIKDYIVFPCYTLRAETIYGVTNIWINPNIDYVIAKVDSEFWILPDSIVIEELRAQNHNVIVLKKISKERLFKDFIEIGEKVINPLTNEKVPILPAEFLDPEIGTGIVMSVPSDAPFDYIALLDLLKDPRFKEIAEECLKNMKSLFKLDDYSEYPAKDEVEKENIKSQNEKEKLIKITKKIYNKEFYNGVAKEIYGKYAGKKIVEFKEDFEKELIEKGIAIKHYTVPIRFPSRYNNKVVVGLVKDQWFLKYSDVEWKKKAHECIDKMEIYPEEVKKLLHEYVDWYKDWAFTHQRELGSTLPWDDNWTLESLSDSTIYMALYTIFHLLKEIPPEKIDYSLFDYVFLGLGDEEEIIKKYGNIAKKMREEFLYWYPLDIRTSGKDLIGNHFVFFIFHHCAIFPENLWPKGILINGWVLSDGKKMSKSLGNYISMKDAYEKYSIDCIRFLLAYAGNSGLDDANIELSKIEHIKNYLYSWYDFCINKYNTGRDGEINKVDLWFRLILYEIIKEIEKEYEKLNTRNIINKIYELDNEFSWYLKRVEVPHREIIKEYIEFKSLALYPIIPHIISEIFEKIGKDPLNLKWPDIKEIDEKTLELLKLRESLAKNIREDIIKIMEILNKKTIQEINIIVARKEKYDILELVKKGKSFDELLEQYKDFREYIIKLKDNMHIFSSYLNYNEELQLIEELKMLLEKEFKCRVNILKEEESTNLKAKRSMPGKPAIIIN